METGWNRRVWEMIARIPRGKVASYGQIAALVGAPRRARHVGFALHATPAGLQIPWHRVINSQGRISLPEHSHNHHLQRALLVEEGVVFDENDRVDFKRHGWKPASGAERE